jgi:Flp pilus assembly protein TadD
MVGSSLHRLGRSDEAIENYRRAVQLKPDDSGLHTRLGSALVRQERLDEAIPCYEQAIQLSPRSAVAFNNFAWMLATCADAKFHAARAVALGKQAVELSPKTGDYWNTLGVARYRAGDFDGAIAPLQRYRELRTDDAEWSNPFFLAMAHWQLGHQDEARRWYGVAVEWMDKQPSRSSEAMKRFRAEAGELLGVNEQK